MVRRCAQAPAAASSASASRCCRVRRKVDSDGTAPVTPSPASVASSASAAHSAIPASIVSRPRRPRPTTARDQPGGRWPGQSVMTARRAWSLASDPAGVATAMITPRAMAALLLPPARPWQATQQPSERTWPTPWVPAGAESHTVHGHRRTGQQPDRCQAMGELDQEVNVRGAICPCRVWASNRRSEGRVNCPASVIPYRAWASGRGS